MLGDRHELHVGEAHRRHVLDELVGQVQVGPALAPRPQVHLVDRQGGLVGSERPALGHPVVVAPRVGALVDDRGVRGSRLGETGHRVGLLPPHPIGAEDVVLVEGPLVDALDEQRPHPSPGHQRERVTGPEVEVALDPDRLRVGRPDREPGSPDLAALIVGEGDHMGPEGPPARGVGACVERCEVLTSQPTPGIMHASHCLPDHARTDPQPATSDSALGHWWPRPALPAHGCGAGQPDGPRSAVVGDSARPFRRPTSKAASATRAMPIAGRTNHSITAE